MKKNKVRESWAFALLIIVIAAAMTVTSLIAISQPSKKPAVDNTSEEASSEAETPKMQHPLVVVHTEEDIELIAQVLYISARGCDIEQQRAVVWVILNRVDSEDFPDTIKGVITQKNQFSYKNAPVLDNLKAVANEVVIAWECEHSDIDTYPIKRNLAPQFVYYYGDGTINYFYEIWGQKENNVVPGRYEDE